MKTILFIIVLFTLVVPAAGNGQDVFSSISGVNAPATLSGETKHQYDLWIRPTAGATRAWLQLFDPGLGGSADLITGTANTTTLYEVFPFDSVCSNPDQPQIRSTSSGAPVYSLRTLDEQAYIDRWIAVGELDAAKSPHGWIVRVRTLSGDDVNTFKLMVTTSKNSLQRANEWSIIAFDLSVCLFNVSKTDEVQFRPFKDNPDAEELQVLGEEDADALLRDLYGNSSSLKSRKEKLEAIFLSQENRWGLAISGSSLPINNLVVRGVKKSVLWYFDPVIVQRPVPLTAVVDQLPGMGCSDARLILSEQSRSQFIDRIPRWIYNDLKEDGDSVHIDFAKPGTQLVSLLLPTRGYYFPQYWVQKVNVVIDEPPAAMVTLDRNVVAPGEPVSCSVQLPSRTVKNALGIRWYINGEPRSDQPVLTFSSLVPGKYEVKLVVTDLTTRSRCSESSDSKIITVNAQPFADVTYPRVVGRSEAVEFSAVNDFDSNGDSLAFEWRGSGIVGSAKGRSVQVRQEKAGDYTMALSVSDGRGVKNSSYSKTFSYRVNAEPQPFFELPLQSAPGNVIHVSAGKTQDPDSKSLSFAWKTSSGLTFNGAEADLSFDHPGDFSVSLSVNDGEGVPNSVQELTRKIHINAPPSPQITAEQRSTSSRQTFSAEQTSDEDQKNLSYGWDFGDASSDTGIVVTHVFKRSGKYLVTLTVDDHQHQTNSVQKATHEFVLNQYPVAQFAVPSLWEPGKPMPLDGRSSFDPDGFVGSYTWLVNGKPISNDSISSVVFKEPGDYAVALKVTDNSGFPDAVGIKTVKVHINYPPVLRWVCTPEIAEPNIPVLFDGSSSYDPDGSVKTMIWTFPDGSSLTGSKVTKTFSKSGRVTYQVTANDGGGFGNSVQSSSGTILVNSSPIIVTKDLIRSNVRSVLLDASKSYDVDGQALSFDWLLPDGSHRPEASFVWETPAPGAHFVTLTVDDRQGKKNSIARETIRILINRPPVAVVDSVIYSCSGQTILFNGSASYDPDGDPISAHWDFTDGTESNETNPAHVYPKPGYYPVTLTLNDGYVDQPTIARVAVIIEGSPVAVLSFKDTTMCVNSPLTMSGDRSFDPNGPIGSFAWDFGDGLTALGSNVAHGYTKPGTYRAILTVVGNGSGRCTKVSQASAAVHVVEGPVAEFTVPERVSVGEDVTLDSSPSRSNGPVTSILWDRFENDSAPLQGAITKVRYDEPGTHTIKLRINVQSTTACNSASATRKIIVNAPPVLTWTVPSDVVKGDFLVADASRSYDPDGIVIEYRWTLDGTTVGAAPVLQYPMMKSGTHTLELKLTDNSGTSSNSVTKSAVVRVNSKPDPKFSLPQTVFENEPISLTPNSPTDADGDSLRFRWKVDGAPSSLEKILLSPGRHVVSLIADDGRGLRNSIDSVAQEVNVIPKPDIRAEIPANIAAGTKLRIDEVTSASAVVFVLGEKLEKTWSAERVGQQSLVLGWVPRNDVLARQSYDITVWEGLKFIETPSVQRIRWNPSNPSVILTAPQVNRPESRNVSFEWRNGDTYLGQGKIVEAAVAKGKNVFTVRAIDQDITGSKPMQTEIIVEVE
jgi:PKD repeat protein